MPKKKIKNLTLLQAKKLCDKNMKIIDGLYQCDKCPFGVKSIYSCKCKLDYNHLDEYGDEEVEV